MQLSKNSKTGRKKTAQEDAAVSPGASSKATKNAPRASQAKKASEPPTTGAKSHRKGMSKPKPERVAETVAQQNSPAKVMVAAAGEVTPSHEEIAKLAYSFWVERNYEHGFADYDWHRANHHLTEIKS